MRASSALAAFVALGIASGAIAQVGGLALPEDGTPSSGTARAGSAAVARDASTSLLNAAGMTRLEKPEVMLTLSPFVLRTEFDPDSNSTATGGDGGDQGDFFPAGGLFLAAPLTDRFAVGFSVSVPVGIGLDPKDNWAGRYYVTEVDLVAVNIEPSFAFRIDEQWSIGAGVSIQYVDFEQKLRINLPGNLPDARAKLDGDSWDVGASASLLWEPTETTRLGVLYRSQVSHNLDGDFEAFENVGAINVGRSISSGFKIPQSVTFSAYHEINDRVALLGSVAWQDWSNFNRTSIEVDGDAGTSVDIPRNWDDVWGFSLGAHIKASDQWLLMFGAGYNSSPVDDEDRTPDLPADEQIRLSAGFEYEMNERWRFGANYTYIWLGDNEIDQNYNQSTGRLSGDYDADIHMLGLYASYRW